MAEKTFTEEELRALIAEMRAEISTLRATLRTLRNEMEATGEMR